MGPLLYDSFRKISHSEGCARPLPVSGWCGRGFQSGKTPGGAVTDLRDPQSYGRLGWLIVREGSYIWGQGRLESSWQGWDQVRPVGSVTVLCRAILEPGTKIVILIVFI